jgi:hypothetical protein
LLLSNDYRAPLSPASEAIVIETKKRKPRRRLALISALIALLGWQILFRPLPKPALYFIADHAGGWMINQDGASHSGVQGAINRMFNLWFEQSVMAQMHDRLPARKTSDDLALLKQRLLQIHPLMINQMDLPHEEILSSNALTGVGKCTGMNMAAAQLLAHDFDRVEMIAIDGDLPDSGHTFGRLWSPQYKDWLYFDIWTAQIQIFSTSRRGAVYLWNYPATLSPEDQVYASRTKPMHDRAPHGHMRLKLQKSFGGYIWYRMGNMIDHGTTWEEEIPIGTELLFIAPEPRLPPDEVRELAVNQSKHAGTFLTARLDHLFGNEAKARKGYLQVSSAKPAFSKSSAPNSTIEAASKIFARRLSKPSALN